MTIAEHEREARLILTKARVDSPGLCARLLTAHALGLDKMAYVLSSQEQMPENQARRLGELLRRRASGEPLAYILGRKEFYGIDFNVNSATLVPRPETELLVDLALSLLPPDKFVVLADLGCGSGCIALTLLKLRPKWRGILLDNSPTALHMAMVNAQACQCDSRLLLGDMHRPPLAPESLDLIVANPPYIGMHERSLVMDETLAHEPHCALFSGAGGTAHLLAAIATAKYSLKSGGLALFEHGAGQQDFMRNAMAVAQFINVREEKDLAGIDRCTVAYKGDSNGGTQRLQPL